MEESKIDLRSDEINDILSRIPAWLIRWGSMIIFLLLAFVVTSLVLIKIPKKITSPAKIITPPVFVGDPTKKSDAFAIALLEIKQENFQKVKIGQTVLLKLSSLAFQNEGMPKGHICDIADSVNINGNFYVKVRIGENENRHILEHIKYGMSGTGEIILERQAIFSAFISGE